MLKFIRLGHSNIRSAHSIKEATIITSANKQIILLICTDQNWPRLIDSVKSELVNKITLSATDFYALMDFSWQTQLVHVCSKASASNHDDIDRDK